MAKLERGLAVDDPYTKIFDFSDVDATETEAIIKEWEARFDAFYTTAGCSIEGAAE